MSTENPILDALEVSILVDRRDKPGQVAWTEWRANVASGCPAPPGSIVMTGASGKIDPCLLPSTTGLLIEVGGVPVVTQTVLNFIAGTGITIVPDAFGGVTFTATGSSSTVSVNGVTVSNPDFNNTTPAAPGGSANVLWQTDGSGHVSAYYLTPQLPITFSPVAHEWLNSYNAVTGLFTATQPSASDHTRSKVKSPLSLNEYRQTARRLRRSGGSPTTDVSGATLSAPPWIAGAIWPL